jgi:hypothetical protein
MKEKQIEMTVYEDTDNKGNRWVCFSTDIAFDAFKMWINSVALAKGVKMKYSVKKMEVNFRRKTR